MWKPCLFMWTYNQPVRPQTQLTIKPVLNSASGDIYVSDSREVRI